MDEQPIKPVQDVNSEQEVYNRNRKRFLKIVQTVLGLAFIIAVIAGATWLIQSKRLEAEKAELKTYQQEIQQKHQELENSK